jgi:hypothetical protein
MVHKAIELSKADKNIKIIRLKNTRPNTEDIEKILWFTLTENTEQFLNLHYINPQEEMDVDKSIQKKRKKKFIRPKRLIFLLIFIFLISHTLFIPHCFSNYYSYNSQPLD